MRGHNIHCCQLDSYFVEMYSLSNFNVALQWIHPRIQVRALLMVTLHGLHGQDLTTTQCYNSSHTVLLFTIHLTCKYKPNHFLSCVHHWYSVITGPLAGHPELIFHPCSASKSNEVTVTQVWIAAMALCSFAQGQRAHGLFHPAWNPSRVVHLTFGHLVPGSESWRWKVIAVEICWSRVSLVTGRSTQPAKQEGTLLTSFLNQNICIDTEF